MRRGRRHLERALGTGLDVARRHRHPPGCTIHRAVFCQREGQLHQNRVGTVARLAMVHRAAAPKRDRHRLRLRPKRSQHRPTRAEQREHEAENKEPTPHRAAQLVKRSRTAHQQLRTRKGQRLCHQQRQPNCQPRPAGHGQPEQRHHQSERCNQRQQHQHPRERYRRTTRRRRNRSRHRRSDEQPAGDLKRCGVESGRRLGVQEQT